MRKYRTTVYHIVCAGCNRRVRIECAHGKTNTRKYCDDCIEEKNRVFNREKYRSRRFKGVLYTDIIETESIFDGMDKKEANEFFKLLKKGAESLSGGKE